MTKLVMKTAAAIAGYSLILLAWSGFAIATNSKLDSQIKFTLHSIYKSQLTVLISLKDLTTLLIEDIKFRSSNDEGNNFADEEIQSTY